MQQTYQVTIIRSDRKTLALQVLPDGQVVVRAPRAASGDAIQLFLRRNEGWIEKKLRQRQEARALSDGEPFTAEELRALAEQAARIIPERIAHFAPLVGVSYGRITIRSQHTRWGSCSSKGNLNFNCLLMRCPLEAVDYVVVHELCHRREMNHSARFWGLVERVLPDYRASRDWLKNEGQRLVERLPK